MKLARRLRSLAGFVIGRDTSLSVVELLLGPMLVLGTAKTRGENKTHMAILKIVSPQYLSHRADGNPALDAFSVASGSSSPSMSSHSNPRSTSHSPKASGLVSAEGESNGRYQSYPPDPRRPTDPSHRCILIIGVKGKI